MALKEETQTVLVQPDDWQQTHPWLVISAKEDSPDETICYCLDEIRI